MSRQVVSHYAVLNSGYEETWTVCEQSNSSFGSRVISAARRLPGSFSQGNGLSFLVLLLESFLLLLLVAVTSGLQNWKFLQIANFWSDISLS